MPLSLISDAPGRLRPRTATVPFLDYGHGHVSRLRPRPRSRPRPRFSTTATATITPTTTSHDHDHLVPSTGSSFRVPRRDRGRRQGGPLKAYSSSVEAAQRRRRSRDRAKRGTNFRLEALVPLHSEFDRSWPPMHLAWRRCAASTDDEYALGGAPCQTSASAPTTSQIRCAEVLVHEKRSLRNAGRKESDRAPIPSLIHAFLSKNLTAGADVKAR